MLVHQLQRRLAGLALGRDLVALGVGQVGLADEGDPEADRRDVGLVIILLEAIQRSMSARSKRSAGTSAEPSAR